ncbi:hypothetical protein CFR73_09690 [Novacetimonas maltaceti]|uniref:Uncharacterized protein n=1 Tax=Novacetimonas maltaceti TaxID=1203393 RepID=A0A2S3W444_9PROT|nr:hypothetical protein [Novacetimonas maltaceti]POF63578.1 hypothetical protein KMAL_07580 [Novacetimonas maltaceti]PYD59849.1 hypothetical protein CFR73_09690 [Novacetimonas maltaceti]
MFSIDRDNVTPTSSLEVLHGHARDAHERLEELHEMLLSWRNEVESLAALWLDAAGRSVMERNIRPTTEAREAIGTDLTDLATENDMAGTALMEAWAQSCYAGRTMDSIDHTGSTLMARLPDVHMEISRAESYGRECDAQATHAAAQTPPYVC